MRFINTHIDSGPRFTEVRADSAIVLEDRSFNNQVLEDLTQYIKLWFVHIGYNSRSVHVEEWFGLPFTSGGGAGNYPAIWNTNSEWEIIRGQFIRGWTLSKDWHVIMLTEEHDEKETDHWYDLGQFGTFY